MLRSGVFYFLLFVAASFVVRSTCTLDPRIVGGMVADITQHPYQLSLQLQGMHLCGASIISNKWAITAAHCISDNDQDNDYTVRAGSNNHNYGGVSYRVKKVFRHLKYDSKTVDYDIALLKIDGKIEFNDKVKPVKLPEEKLPVGAMVNITGWGKKQWKGESSSVLLKVSVPIVNRTICRERYNWFNNITDRMLCAGDLQRGGKDACQDDSGGPLTADGVLYGIVSWGYQCAEPGYPGVYTDVAIFKRWIRWMTII